MSRICAGRKPETNPMKLTIGIRVLHLIIRWIVIVNFILLGIDLMEPFGFSLNGALRLAHLHSVTYDWLVMSTVALPVLLITAAVQRVLQSKKTRVESHRTMAKGILIDAILVVAWLITVIIALVRSAAGFA
jgi:hypothetical protein